MYCNKVKVVWKIAIIGLLLVIIGQLRTLDKKFDEYFDIPDVIFEEPQDGKDINNN